MPRLALQLRAQFTNVTSLLPSDPDHTLMLKLKCSSCHEEHSKLVGVTPSDQHEMTKGARGSANLVMSCNFCKKESSAKFDEPTQKEPLWKTIEADQDSGAEWQTLCVLDFRGLEPVGFDPQGQWTCKGTDSGTVFDKVEFEEDGTEWLDYDEKAGQEVSIMELESRWQRV
ncbi:hypothetical protein NDA11_001103 [Ustilago hordei]|uniref:DUF866 domain protein n=1 Tax=Ustilago hordei TaxID=120017 RepID=I2FTP5_USTHO|nr:hypothetical protein NDA10_007417 [Ustilago hordei]KAJ1575084.1 hypothetical protein NDA15_006974 [Ustilago hordei]KAJ1593953.1 hypothetical protein NDA12_000547 [Ustilago hordei]KAJ1594691.1 hypothetical protein NDA11_001103 [Ustilago hordei]KAJ1597465.1 hypothetical protein NDA14_000579 [Ustilago hordei]